MSDSKLKTISSNHIQELSEHIGMKLDTDTFCMLPFVHLSTTTEGQIRLCCRSQPIGDISESSLLDVWNSDRMNNIRKDLVAGQKPKECSNCWKLEEKGIVSLRMGQNIARTKVYGEQIKKWTESEELLPPTLELKLSNRCNLRCMMCSPAASTPWMRNWKKVEHVYDESHRGWVNDIIDKFQLNSNPNLNLFSDNPSFIEDFKKISTQITMLDFAGGEPLIDPLHYDALRVVIENGQAPKTTLRYSTNLTVLNFEKFDVLELWSHFKEIHLTISIDGPAKLNEYIRVNLKSNVFEENLKKIRAIDPSGIKIKLKGSTTISALNALYLAETAQYIVNELGIPWHTSRVTQPSFLDARVWPLHIREKSCEKLRELSKNTHFESKEEGIRFYRHIDDSVSWLSEPPQPNQPELLKKFMLYLKAHELDGQQKFQDLVPEYQLL